MLVTAALIRPTVRALRWPPFLAAAGVGLVVVALPAAWDADLTVADFTRLLRIAAVCGGLGAAFLFDDPAARSTPAVPTSRLVRHAVRVAVALPAIAIWWATVLVAAAAGPPLPTGALTLEAGAVCAVALALAAASGSTVAAPALLVWTALAGLLPDRVALFVREPADPGWAAAHRRWWVLLAVALVCAVLASRDRRRHPPLAPP
jgi:fluoroquinolone transport system permease protein